MVADNWSFTLSIFSVARGRLLWIWSNTYWWHGHDRLVFRDWFQVYDREISSRTKPGTTSAMFLPQTNDHAWLTIAATPTYLCSRMHVATNRGAASIWINTVVPRCFEESKLANVPKNRRLLCCKESWHSAEFDTTPCTIIFCTIRMMQLLGMWSSISYYRLSMTLRM